MEVLYDFTNKTQAQVLLSCTSHKGWRTRNLDKANQLIPLEDSTQTEKDIQKYLANVKKYTDILSQQAH